MSPLEEYFLSNTGRPLHKWHHYFDIYHRHFERFRGKSPVVLEIGVWYGGSIQMWQHYFGPGMKYVGIDIESSCKRFEDTDTTIMVGDQADRQFLREIARRFPQIDILIDDGGHTMGQQIATFEELYPAIQREGVYLCEDVCTSMLSNWGGGYRKPDTFLEYSKRLIDNLYGWYSEDKTALPVNDITRSTHGLHFYDSIIVIEKKPITPPVHSVTGVKNQETPRSAG